jgi:hypothetical protein
MTWEENSSDLRTAAFDGFDDPATDGASFFNLAAAFAFSFAFLSFSAFAAARFFDSE